MQRDDTIAAYRTATSNLGNGMAQQTTQAIDSIDRVLREIDESSDSRASTGADCKGDAYPSRFRAARQFGQRACGRERTGGRRCPRPDPEFNRHCAFAETDVSNRDFFLHFATGDHRDAFVGPPIRNGVTGKWTAIMSRRIGSAYGAFSGVAIAELALDSIEDFLPGRDARETLGFATAKRWNRSRSFSASGRRDRQEDPGSLGMVCRGRPRRRRLPRHRLFYADPGCCFRASTGRPAPCRRGLGDRGRGSAGWPRQILWLVLGAAAAIIGAVMLLKHLARQVDRLESSRFSLASKNVELETAHSQLDAVLANISLGVCFFSADRKLIVGNQGYKNIYDLPPEALRPGTPLTKIMDHLFASDQSPRVGRDEYVSSRDQMIESGARQQAVVELMSGQSVLVTNQPMPNGGWISTHEDITARREADRQIRFLAHHDPLTALANRTSFAVTLNDAVARLSRCGTPFSVFMIDLDRFKEINDTMGHPAGDQLLCETAQRLKSSLRKTDVLARLGGDEFAIIQASEEDAREGATALATRILTRISEPYDIDGKAVFVGASIGIALAPKDAADGNTILKMADLALYEAKNAGRNGFRFVDASSASNHQQSSRTGWPNLGCDIERGVRYLDRVPRLSKMAAARNRIAVRRAFVAAARSRPAGRAPS
jgi:diguanylate cyclase (GGDEF)-like protein